MARTKPSAPRSDARSRLAIFGLALTLAAPLAVFVGIAGLKFGAWGIDLAYDVLTMKIGLVLAGLGVVGALVAAVSGAMARRQAGWMAVVAVVVSAATVVLFYREVEAQRTDRQYGGGVSTNAEDPPGFPEAVVAERRSAGADPLASGVGPNGCEIAALPTQVAPGVAGYALQEAGFTVRSLGVGRGDGRQVSPWFDRTHDAVIRIRPGRTDVRVAPRDGVRDHGASCRLAVKIIQNLR